MFTLAFRAAAAAVAATVLILVGSRAILSPDDKPDRLGDVFDLTTSSETLHLVVYHGEKKTDVWANRDGRLRLDDHSGQYTIAAGPTVWRIDEKANRATSGPSPYFVDEQSGPDLLALLDLPELEDRQTLLDQRTTGVVERESGDLFLYRVSCPSPSGTIHFRVAVDATTRLLQSIEATAQRQGKLQRLGRLVLVGIDEPVDEGLFVVGDALTEDGRIGVVDDAQGIAAVRPAMNERWTPVAGRFVLKPGDWLRTDLRGANAMSVRLAPDTQITIGPGSLVEMVMPREIRVHRGELKVDVQGKPVRVIGPDEKRIRVKGVQLVRVHDEQLTRLESDPLWLQGFEGRTAVESMGSLVANVDGRNEPLTIGYHKVTVDIRDQVARTTIEESFVNHLRHGTLEGVFHFPLPSDASISGFGMWIGDTLVEADVVEKQRAREIYETILREKRDPGLLEWSGGNIFKARVFPIPAGGEKRIKITYTQVLPRRGDRYHYSYALKSEMLRQTPLRELMIEVNVHSTTALANVLSPTHMTRNALTAHSAKLEFSEQEYTPTRDFEVAVELDAAETPPVVLIPHRRGDDGYFMLQVTPPDAAEQSARDVLPDVLSDSEPLDVLVLADTSASIDAEAAEVRNAFIASLLGALTPGDSFNLAVCDVDCVWAFEERMSADAKNVDLARRLLDDRVSLGWSDLDRAFASALERAGERTHIVYVGDGVVAGKDVDPTSFVNRLKRLHEGSTAAMHAVSVSSSFEPVVMRTIGTLGGGSSRQITGEQGPSSAAVELLGELSAPTLRDLKIEFPGLSTARVYPSQLPNLAAGTQQILLGRYLPAVGVEQQSGHVVVTGRVGDEEVRLETQGTLPGAAQTSAGAEESFLPRLWARMHLDSLLEEGPSAAMKDEIIALSEEYHIMTPYTSLLVLETDEDRERFKVKRRFQMRDGEKYFQQGRDAGRYELVQQQMRRAGDWRVGLRTSVLAQLAAMGRSTEAFGQQWGGNFAAGYRSPLLQGAGVQYNRIAGPGNIPAFGSTGMSSPNDWQLYMRGHVEIPDSLSLISETLAFNDRRRYVAGSAFVGFSHGHGMDDYEGQSLSWYANGKDSDDSLMMMVTPRIIIQEEEELRLGISDEFGVELGLQDSILFDRSLLRQLSPARPRSSFSRGSELYRRGNSLYAGLEKKQEIVALGSILASSKPMDSRYYYSQRINWPNVLFPSLAAVPVKPQDKQPERPWSPEARELAESLLRTEQLRSMTGGLRIEQQSESYNPRWDELTHRSDTLSLVSSDAWLRRSGGAGSATTVNWVDENERGVLSRTFGLGRVRKSVPLDQEQWPISAGPHMLRSIGGDQAFTVTMRPQGEDRVLLTLVHPDDVDLNNESHLLVDTARAVLLRSENYRQGKLRVATEYSQFVEALGAWWPTLIEGADADGRRTSLVTLQYSELDAEAFDRQMARELAGRDRVAFLHEPVNDVTRAKQALAADEATFEDQLVLALHFQQTQQWERVLEHLAAAEALASDKPGTRWIRAAILIDARRHEEARTRILDEAGRLAKTVTNGAHDTEGLFLANYLIGQASSVFEANETLAMLDTLLPVYREQPPHVGAMRQWKGNRVSYLRQAGQSAQALELQRQLALATPHSWNVQRDYAQALFNARLPEQGYAWLDRVLVPESQWLPSEEGYLRDLYAERLRSEGRHEELVDFLADSLESKPTTDSLYRRYLTALLQTDRIDEVNRVIAQWLLEGRTQQKLPEDVASRISSATSQALGDGYRIQTNRLDERWLDPLSDVVRHFGDHESHARLAERIMGHGRFKQTDHCRALRRETLKRLTTEMETLAPNVASRFIGWINANDPAVEKDVWQGIARDLRARWEAEPDIDVRNQWSQTLAGVLDNRIGEKETVDFFRERWNASDKKYRASYAAQLFKRLLAQAWTAEYENEAFALLDQRASDDNPGQAPQLEVHGLHQLTDAMVRARYTALEAEREHPEELDRNTLRAQQEKNLRTARIGFSDRLREAIRHSKGPITRWMNLERLYLDVRLNRNLDRVAEECWAYLDVEPITELPEDVNQMEASELVYLLDFDPPLRNRCLLTLANLAARRDADERLIRRLLAYVDRQIEADVKRAAEDGLEADIRWKLFKYELLVALDRPEALRTSLESWIQTDPIKNHWRLALGYILAEQGKIALAIELFEAVRADDELGPTEHRTLADWYMVVDEKEKHEAALLAVLMTTSERDIQNTLRQQLLPWLGMDPPPPAELDPAVLRGFAAVFRKSGRPQNHLNMLRDFYQATHDFRLSTGLADAVIGHTAGRVYPFLQGMNPVFSEIREEAAVDSIVERIDAVREKATTDVDHRALDLLEVLAERRAAEMLNQPGPHAQKALSALQRAFQREWTPGEPRLMADFLAHLGSIADADLAAEQLRQLQALHAQETPGTLDRLHVAYALTRTLWSYNEGARPIDLLQAALAEYQAASDGRLPAEANGPLGALIDHLELRGAHTRAEEILETHLASPASEQQALWLTQRLYALYESALHREGRVSLGSGPTLYRAAIARIQADLEKGDDSHRYQLVIRLCSIFRAVRDRNIADVAEELTAFAFQRMPQALERQTNNHHNVVGRVADTLDDLLGPRAGLEFLIERIENEPSWFRYNRQDGWYRHNSRLGSWRQRVGELGDLEDRLLALVTRELRRELEFRQSGSRSIWWMSHDRFWTEKADAFAQTAEEVYAERKQSGAAVKYIAEYLYRGLGRHDRAIEILFVAHAAGLLDENGQVTLVNYLQSRNRYGESIALLAPLVELRPDKIDYRVLLMRAYFHSARHDELAALREAADAHFRDGGRWQENVIAALADVCRETRLYEHARTYYGEVIPLHQKTQPNRGIGGAKLSQYYRYLARVCSALGDTPAAVDAACQAIASWGTRHDNRQDAIDSLKSVIQDSADLDAFVTQFDAQTAESGLDNPMVRKALGQVYLERTLFDKALAQLRLAVALQPNDPEIHTALVACFDGRRDPQGAVGQRLASLRLARRDIELYKDLGRRLDALEQPAQAERAYTSLVEMLPHESEGHAALAEIRQAQNRWPDAADHWRQVAEIRSLEPTGLLRLAQAQIQLKQWDEALATLGKLDATAWPARFGNVHNQVRQFERQIDEQRRKLP